MKHCSKCKTIKPLSEFYVNRTKKDGLQSQCRECKHNYFKEYYARKTDQHKAKTRKQKLERKRIARIFVDAYLAEHPCAHCLNDDIEVLEFDHLPQFVKLYNISNMIHEGMRVEVIQEEIAKCQVLCANCHTKETRRRARNQARVTQLDRVVGS